MIEVLLTDKWIEAAGYLQLLCLMALVLPFETINGNVLYVKGKSNYILTTSIIGRFLFVCLIFTLISFGLTGLVIALIVYSYIRLALFVFFARKIINYKFANQVKDVSVFFFLTVVSLIVMIPLNYLIENSLLKLILIVTSGAGVYIFLSYLLKLKEIGEVIKLIKNKS
jgi:O-antigen/teichoic acid export membrane protein